MKRYTGKIISTKKSPAEFITSKGFKLKEHQIAEDEIMILFPEVIVSEGEVYLVEDVLLKGDEEVINFNQKTGEFDVMFSDNEKGLNDILKGVLEEDDD